ncbi:MAG: hypothetical protein CM1200mP13_09690 [Candidatus Pelagibacterales bacterium]|nr:MAG: hypothetical protein CM1200mP13_09690 [Pelagibacterales bacterium]
MSLILIIFGIFVFADYLFGTSRWNTAPVVQVQTDYKSASAEIVEKK